MVSDTKNDALFDYLLGRLSEHDMNVIEEKYFLDDEFYEELQSAERDLIDRYAHGELGEDDRVRFEKHFLSSPARHEKVRFARLFKSYLSNLDSTRPVKADAVARKGPFRWRLSFASPLTVAASLALLLIVGLGVWRVAFYQSDLTKGLTALNQAYRNRRPGESRISGFDYAPAGSERGDGQRRVNQPHLALAQRIILEAYVNNPDPETSRAMGRLYLAQGDLEQAIHYLKEALKGDQKDAGLYNDLGAALLESWRKSQSDGEPNPNASQLEESLEYFNEALKLDGSSQAALFNRALAYEHMLLLDKAREDWERYITLDQSSEWANEARDHLRTLDEKRASAGDDEELFQTFLQAFAGLDDRRAWELISRNRNITGGYIENRLVDDYLELKLKGRDEEAKERLKALEYAGALESARADDHFIADLIKSYRSSSPAQLAALAQARGLMKTGKKFLDASQTEQAIESFNEAKAIYGRLGNSSEYTYTNYPLGHSYLLQPKPAVALSIFDQLASACDRSKYRWLLAQALNAKANAQVHLKEYSLALETSSRSLKVSEEIGDTAGVIKTTSQIAHEYLYLNNYEQSLSLHQRSLQLTRQYSPEPIQLWRNYFMIAQPLYFLRLYSSAIEYEKEALRLALKLNMPQTVSRSYTNLALMLASKQEFDAAAENIMEAFEVAKTFPSKTSREEALAYSFLQFGALYKKSGELDRALTNYKQAISLYEKLGMDVFSYMAVKGHLLCCLAMGGCADVDGEIDSTLKLSEQYRSKILEESNRNIFFDVEQDVYDVVIDFQYSKRGDPATAFDYSEMSHARSLHDRTQMSLKLLNQRGGDEPRSPQVSNPLKLKEVQARMPAQAQVVEYAVLGDKVIIWVISKDEPLRSTTASIKTEDLNDLVRSYLKLVSTPALDRREEANRLARQLYDLLVKPVESWLDDDKQICVVPDKILNYLPFGALVSASGKYLLEEMPVIQSPSSSIFMTCSDSARERQAASNERLLSVGDPKFDRQYFKSLDYLPSAQGEATQITAYYKPSLLLVGSEAVKKTVTAEMVKSDVVHLAMHAVADAHSPMRSRLLLAKECGGAPCKQEPDGVLYADELYKLNLPRTRLVVLSSCRSGIENYYSGEGMVGISRPFIAQRVPLVVASLWPVDSNATATLMIRFHRYRKAGDGLPTAVALRRAQQDMLGGSSTQYNHPYYWAGFTVIGGYARF